MSSELELKTLDSELKRLADESNEKDLKEAELLAQIAALRLDIAKLRDEKLGIKQKIREVSKNKESAERKAQLEKEAAEIERSLAEKRKEAEEILKNAPWRDVAFEWQIEGALRLPERALLADKRGLGKTLSSIMWFRFQKAKKILVCLRKEVASDFIKELSIREPKLFVWNLIGKTSEERKMAAFLLNGHEEFVVVTNIESWRRNVDQTTEDILKIDYDAVILDEAHHIKNFNTGTAQGFLRLAQKIPKVLELTGTPIKNRPQEMFTLLHALYPDQFPRESKFLYDYCVQIQQNRWVFSPIGLKHLVKQISHFYISRTPEDIGRQVPPPQIIEYKLDFENHRKQKAAYQSMTEMSLAILESGKTLPIVSQLALMTRQAQVVSWPAGIVFTDPETDELIRFDVHESVKMDWAEELIQELVGEGERVILFSRFKPAIYELKNRLKEAGVSVAVITGEEKGERIEVFNDFDLKTAPENPKYQVLLATYQTVGESANLNAATHMVLYDRFWNPGNEDQAIGRVDRLNSTVQATVHIPYVEGTIDGYMAELIDGKRSIVAEFKSVHEQQQSLIEHLKKTV